jgi:hypothetical protein
VRETLSTEHFSQIPQLEPESTRGTLFRWGDSPATTGTLSGATGDAAALERLFSLLRDILDALRQSQRAQQAGRAVGEPALVYVHGICRHDRGYSDPWWRAMRPHLSSHWRTRLEANRHEVLWSDLVTPEGTRFVEARAPREEAELTERLKEALEDRAEQQAVAAAPQHEAGVAPRAAPLVADRAALGIPGLNCIDDFAKYLLYDDIRRAVQQRFLDQVEPLLRNGASVDVISHSWGTVVAFEALRRLDGQHFDGVVHNLFTVGSALSIVPVKNRLRPGDGRRPRHVRRWVNLDARGDIVGGALQGRPFEVDLEYLNLHPTDCNAFLGLIAPACAHSSYFREANAAVNRDIFTRHIED